MATLLRTRIGMALALTAGALGPLAGQEPAVSAPPGPDFEEVHRYAELAQLAYQPDSVILARLAGRYEVVIRDVPATQGRYVLLTSGPDSLHVVAVRGTSDLRNALEDVEYVQSLDSRLKVRLHRGFAHSAHEIYRDLRPELRPGYRIQLTGHSLGGAVAAILMMHLHADGFHVSRVVTFGQPKVTNAAGMRAYTGFPVLRVVNCRDPVPLVPPLTLLSAAHGPYRHFGPETILLDDSLYVYLPEHDAERLPVTSFWRHLGQENPEDHHMPGYLRRVAPKLARAVAASYGEMDRRGCGVGKRK